MDAEMQWAYYKIQSEKYFLSFVTPEENNNDKTVKKARKPLQSLLAPKIQWAYLLIWITLTR